VDNWTRKVLRFIKNANKTVYNILVISSSTYICKGAGSTNQPAALADAYPEENLIFLCFYIIGCLFFRKSTFKQIINYKEVLFISYPVVDILGIIHLNSEVIMAPNSFACCEVI
jgi:hypothetical protein